MKFTIALSVLLAAMVAPVQSPAQDTPKPPNFSVVYAFTRGADGEIIEEGEQLALDREGNIYGTGFGTIQSPDCFFFGCGTVFKIDPKGKESTLHSFTGPPDGNNPLAGVTLDKWGNVYGMTEGGGTDTAANESAGGYGAVFKIDPAGNESILYSFTNSPDGGGPNFSEGLTLGKNGDLYGTTYEGGIQGSCNGCGTVFKVTPNGRETVLYRFLGGAADGWGPGGNLAQDDEGNLYGVTAFGGSYNGGTIFKLNPRGNETVLYSFTGGADGWGPLGVIRDCDGTLYGVTFAGGSGSTYSGYGVAFKLDSKGVFSVLHTFTNRADGGHPAGRLLRIGTDLCGATNEGGDLTDINCAGFGCGVVYKLDSAGNQTVLYTFTGFADGDNPAGGLVQDREGNLYGLTEFGGDLASPASSCLGFGCGVVYKLSPTHRHWDVKSEFATD